MTRVAKFLNSRQIALFFSILIILFLFLFIYYSFTLKGEGISFDKTMLSLPWICGISIILTQGITFSFFLYKSQNVPKSADLNLKEFLPSSVILILVVSVFVLFFISVIMPDITTSIYNKNDNKKIEMPGYKIPSSKELKSSIELFYKKKYKKSLLNLNKFLKDFPNNIFARIYKQYSLKAINKLKKMRKISRRDYRIFQIGLKHYNDGKYYLAINEFSRVLNMNPKYNLARKYIKLAKEGLKTGSRIGNVSKKKGLKVRIDLALAKGINFYSNKKYWQCYLIMKDVLLVDEFNDTAKRYLDLCRQEISKFDFFLDEFINLHYYSIKKNVFLPLAKKQFLFIRYFIKKYNVYYGRKLWILKTDNNLFCTGTYFAEYAKWLKNKLILRNVKEYIINKNGFFTKEHKIITIDNLDYIPEKLWDMSSLLYNRNIMLTPFKIFKMFPVFKRYNIPVTELRIKLTDVFAFPVSIFCISILTIGAGWRYRAVIKPDKNILIILSYFIVYGFITLYSLYILVQLFYGTVFLTKPYSFLSYFIPSVFSLILIVFPFILLPKINKNLK